MDSLLLRIDDLPSELIDYIKIFIPTVFLMWVNKKYYLENHVYLVKEMLLQKRYDKYIRKVVERDNEFIFQTVLKEHNIHLTKKYIYKQVEYKNLYYFMIDYCIEKEATKCRNALNEYLFEAGLCQNRDKKNRMRSIRWRN